MSGMIIHILLFMVAALAIVGMGTCYGDAEDGPALRSFPRRFLMFLGGCALLAAIMIVLEQTIASVH